MGSFEYFEHTADVGLRVWSDSLDDLFETVARGLMGYVVSNLDEVQAEAWESFSLEAESLPELLAKWLNELIFRVETTHCLFSAFEARVERRECRLHARIGGQAIDRGRHALDHEVKAATHHGLVVEEMGAGGWKAEVVLDI